MLRNVPDVIEVVDVDRVEARRNANNNNNNIIHNVDDDTNNGNNNNNNNNRRRRPENRPREFINVDGVQRNPAAGGNAKNRDAAPREYVQQQLQLVQLDPVEHLTAHMCDALAHVERELTALRNATSSLSAANPGSAYIDNKQARARN